MTPSEHQAVCDVLTRMFPYEHRMSMYWCYAKHGMGHGFLCHREPDHEGFHLSYQYISKDKPAQVVAFWEQEP